MDESEELSGLEGMLALTWVSLAVISYKRIYSELIQYMKKLTVSHHFQTNNNSTNKSAYYMYAHTKAQRKQHSNISNILTVLSFKLSCPISFLSSAGSTTSPPMKSSILVCAALALILFRMPRRTEPIVSLVCDQISKSST